MFTIDCKELPGLDRYIAREWETEFDFSHFLNRLYIFDNGYGALVSIVDHIVKEYRFGKAQLVKIINKNPLKYEFIGDVELFEARHDWLNELRFLRLINERLCQIMCMKPDAE